MKDLTNKGGKEKDVESILQVGDVQLWYKHDLDEDKTFYKKVESAEDATKQIVVIYSLMQYMKRNFIVGGDKDSNGGFDVLGADNKNTRTVIRDEAAEKDADIDAPKEGDLRLWYMQIFGRDDMFHSKVACADDAMKQLFIIYELVLFLYQNDQIPDYCNAGGLEVYESDGEGGFEWCEWQDENGMDSGEIMAMHTDTSDEY